MKIVIDIPEEVFDEIYNENYYSLKGKEALRVAVRNDTIDRVLETIELNKFSKHNDDEQAKEWNKWLDDLTDDIKTLKGDERK